LFEQFVYPHLTTFKAGWDNFSEDEVQDVELQDLIDSLKLPPAHSKEMTSDLLQEACSQRCGDWDKCFQWKLDEKGCHLSEWIMLGKKDDSARSGWNMTRITRFRAFQDCDGEDGF